MQVKSTIRYHLTPVKMAINQKLYKKKNNAGKGMEKREPSYTVGGM